MNEKKGLPVKGAWVTVDGELGVAWNTRTNGSEICLQVKFVSRGQLQWVNLREVRGGFQPGMEVQDVPVSRTRKSLGEGTVLKTRRIGTRDQVLVEFLESGRPIWLPYENLRRIKSPSQRFILGKTGNSGSSDRFRLRCLAFALEMWNENTGALSRLDIDPLPHQIHLVHHILRSGNLNWLIGDDVGLGKTIEVGMLLAALEQRGDFRRILIVTPAGLVRQWQEELHHKFGMSDYQIYGTDFEVNNPQHWKLHDHVIGSIDRFKSERHLDILLQAGVWDLIVFDEAHRLSRRQWGGKYDASERFRLAATLRTTTDAMLLLSGTPHQGMQDKFQAILELLRPEWKDQVDRLPLNPEILRDMVIRNHKADVTDADGKFIFQGTLTRAIRVPSSRQTEEFDQRLRIYLMEGYSAGKERGRQGLAIGFVMTVYRKLGASSIAAIQMALERRLNKLIGEYETFQELNDDTFVEDERFAGEQEEASETPDDEFFEGEITMLRRLLNSASEARREDWKLRSFLDDLVPQIESQRSNEKVLIFTEYRATQEYVRQFLEQRYGQGSVFLIHGSQDYRERELAIRNFEAKGRFLISTEAGGEGLNLHRECHVIVNYDLPWNPMRLVQRVGRLYRYGQKERVIVFNLLAPDTFDAKIVSMMYDRISQVVNDMSSVSREFNLGLRDEILGELADMLDVEAILEEASHVGIRRTKERIDEALRKARDAIKKQQELFQYAAGFESDEFGHQLSVNINHVRAFIEGMINCLNIHVANTTHGGRVLDLRLPQEIRDFVAHPRRSMRITFDREIAARNPTIQMMDLDSPFFEYLIERAKSYVFGGMCANITGLDGIALVTSILRWHNDQGVRMRQEYAVYCVRKYGQVDFNPEQFATWMIAPARDGTSTSRTKDEANLVLTSAKAEMDRHLSNVSNVHLHPENFQIVSAGWCD